MPLSDTAVRNAKLKDKPYKLTDGEGLYLLVKPNGGKYWRFKYLYVGKEKLLALGTYPEISLGEARDKRQAARKLVADGTDPGTEKKEAKRRLAYNVENSFQVVAKEWHETNKPKWRPDHAAGQWRRLELHMLPAIGDRPIAEIKALDLLDAIRKVEKLGNTETSHRLLHTCSVIFRYAVLTGRITYNPAQDLKGALMPHKKEHHPTIQAKEIPEFFKQLKKVDVSDLKKLAIRLLMLTFVRQGEMRQATWDDVDFEGKEWRLPAHTTKMNDLHIVPLATQTIKLLEELKKLTGEGKFLFPSERRRHHLRMNENAINYTIHKMGYKGKMVGHAFRALASTTLNEMGFPPDVIERQLAHAERNQVRAAYNHAEYLPQRREMMQKWGDFIEGQTARKPI